MKIIFLMFLVFISALNFAIKKDDENKIADFKTLPTLKWKFETSGPVFSSPTIKDGLVYFGSLDSTLYAVEIQSGKLKWKYKTAGQIRSTVNIEDNQLFLVGGEGVFYSINKNSGELIWTFKTEGENTYKFYGYADYFNSSPVINNDALYFGSGDGNIYALKTTTGELIWKFETGDVVHSTPAISGDKLIAGSFDGNVYALNNSTGKLLWKFKSVGQRFFPKGEMQGNPVIANDLIYIGSRDYNLYAIDIEQGYCHWNKQFPKGWALALSINDSVLYAGTSDDDVMVSIDGKSGTEKWRTDVNFNTFGAPAFSQSMMYFGTLLGQLRALDFKTGEIIWTFNTDGFNSNNKNYFEMENKISKERFYSKVGSPDGYIKALYELGAIFSTPTITDENIIFTSTDGTVYCLQR